MQSVPQTVAGANSPSTDRSFFGHPRGLATLFFTEMWERFTYYGMRALLILFLVASVDRGGLGFSDGKAGAIYGLFTSMVYLTTLPGGWIADRLMGQRRTVLLGGITIAAGSFLMVIPGTVTFYLGLTLIVMGTGLLKANISTMVGALYSTNDNRRDAGFSIFYMGINIGALIAPLICGYVGEKINWRYGFGLAGIGMTCGLIQFVLGWKHLGEAGKYAATVNDPAQMASDRKLFFRVLTGVVALLVVLGGLTWSGVLPMSAEGLADVMGYVLLAVVVIFFAWLLFTGDWTPVERKRFVAIFVLFLAATLFWSAFEQAGSTLNLFAERSTDRTLTGAAASLTSSWFPDHVYPASWFQSVNSIFIILLAPVLGWLWIRLGSKEPSSAAKFALGLVFVGLGYLVIIPGAIHAATGVQVSSIWLWSLYLLHTIGELCISPVGLSAMTKLAPPKVVGLMMGVWFMAASAGNYIGGRMASVYEAFSPVTLFSAVAAFCIVLGLLLGAFTRPMKRLMGGIR